MGWGTQKGANSLRCTKILSQYHPFLSFLPSFFYHVKMGWGTQKGANFLRCTKISSQHHLFLFFLPNPFLPCKNTFMDDYDGIYNCNSLKYNPLNFFEKF
jgi:hypothetical protein